MSQLFKAAPPDCRTVYDITLNLAVVNFAAIHTTSIVSDAHVAFRCHLTAFRPLPVP
jgi:hypothetical protein